MRLWLLIFLLLLNLSLYSQTGPNNPAASSTNASIGIFNWNNIGNVFVSDDVRADVPLNNNGDDSYYLVATDFGFSIPGTDIINGIVVEIERSDDVGDGNVKDNSVKIVQGGSILGTEKAAAGNWPSVDAYQTYGGAVDLWGLTWTAADINANNFGIAISSRRTAGGGNNGARVDHIRITVYHSAPMPIELISFTGIQKENKIELSWITASEINNDYFLLEKTLDGINFEPVGVIDGAGNSSTQNFYFFFDNQPAVGVNYYRLTQVDYNGISETFLIIAVDFNSKEKFLVRRITLDGKNFYVGYSGVYIEIYNDGSYRKVFKQILSE